MREPEASDSGFKVGLLVAPLGLAALLQAAHFLRWGALPFVVLSLALPFLLLARRVWAVRVVQAAALLSALGWLWTAFRSMQERQLAGVPYLRMLAILGGVALFTAASALLLETDPLRRLLRRAGR